MDDTPLHSNRDPRDPGASGGLLARLRERGVLRVAASYALIAWLLLQIADVTFDPLGLPKWVMTALIAAAVLGFPIAIALAWFYEIGERVASRDTTHAGEARPVVRGRRHYADFVVIGVLLVTVAVLLVRQSDIGKPKPPEDPAIAVLPFENIGGDPQQEYFSDGLAQELLDRLGRVPGLTVTARSSSFSFKGKQVDARTVAKKLGVTTILAGSVRRAANRMKLSAHLIDGATGQQVWSGSYDRELTDVFQVQEELAAAIIEAIVPAARRDALAKVAAPPTDLSAYDLYLLGRAAQEGRVGGRAQQAVDYLERSVRLDPGFAKGHAALSRALVLWTSYGLGQVPKDTMARAEAAAYRALALDPDSSEGHAALGTVWRNLGRPGAEEQYRRALELNPNNVVALYDLGVAISSDPSRAAESEALQERVLRLDPRSAAVWRNKLAQAEEVQDGGATYERELARALEILSDDPDGLRLIGYDKIFGESVNAYRWALRFARAGDEQAALRGAVLAWMGAGDFDRAQRFHDELGRRPVHRAEYLGLGTVLAGRRGDYEKVHRLLEEARASGNFGWEDAVAAFWLCVQGRYAEAAVALERAGPLPERYGGPAGASLLDGRQLLPAALRIYRATGRGVEADAMAAKYLAMLRDQPGIDLAALAANEGLKDVAVETLREFVRIDPMLRFFDPSMPWFKSLEGHPGYADVLAERQRRQDRIRAELLSLEEQAAGTVLQLR